MSRRLNPIVVLAVLAGIVLVVVAIVYFAVGANDLPSFFPGHSDKGTGTHPKRGIAAAVVAAVCFAYAWTTLRAARR
jgi:drug/metabolite transporter (DMT)-like permease